MRIQHNIMAMSAYRNYTNNVSAMKANLEKLSSGYKINRAGDDAAGLAISEKMRAQITGLETAQKNAKDGISLVQTAEGALTEVHDMLNRMVELATQSANGTYDNDTDRAQLQKEMDQLREEINRIADSSNFNGIQLLDGSMDENGDISTKVDISSMLPEVGSTLGTNTVLHSDPSSASGGSSFSIDLHNVALKAGDTLSITLGEGDSAVTLAYTATNNEDGSTLVQNIVNGLTTGATAGTTPAAGETLVNGAVVATNQTIKINGQDFEVSVGSNGDDRITFTQVNAPTQETEEVDPSMKVTISGASISEPSAATKDVQTATAGTVQTAFTNGAKLVIGSTTYTVVANGADESQNQLNAGDLTADVAGAAKIASLIAAEYNSDDDAEYVAEAQNDGTIVFTAKEAGAVGGEGPNAAPTLPTISVDISAGGAGVYNAGSVGVTTGGADTGAGTPTIKTGIADYNVSTTDQVKATAAGASRLASTHFQLTKEMVEDGAKLQIGAKTYEFGKDVKIDDLDSEADDYLDQVAERLTKAAEANTTYTVGHDGSRMTFTEIEGQTDYDLTTLKGDAAKKEGVENSFGFTGAAKSGKSLTLQIGDTADSYNQLKVNISDCHTSSLGIADISISDQDSAAEAVKAIKNAINYVSDVRGTLGATQNRLDHTINNLSVMTENIQDAESTIRDVDVAEEMMAYTKNNILIQASQAMLAQANQVPQGVLQLLQ